MTGFCGILSLYVGSSITLYFLYSTQHVDYRHLPPHKVLAEYFLLHLVDAVEELPLVTDGAGIGLYPFAFPIDVRLYRFFG